MKKIEFYFDFMSPYSYLAWNWVRVAASRGDIEFEYYPVIMSKVIHHYETKGPAEIDSKRNYLYRDCLRYTSLNDIPFATPEKLPFNSLYALRMALKENVGPSHQHALIDSIFSAGWGQGMDIGDPDVLIETASRAGVDGISVQERTSQPEMREALKKNVENALSQGVFGVPTFIVDGELFWGNDSIPHLRRYLDGEDVLDRERAAKFEREFPGA